MKPEWLDLIYKRWERGYLLLNPRLPKIEMIREFLYDMSLNASYGSFSSYYLLMEKFRKYNYAYHKKPNLLRRVTSV